MLLTNSAAVARSETAEPSSSTAAPKAAALLLSWGAVFMTITLLSLLAWKGYFELVLPLVWVASGWTAPAAMVALRQWSDSPAWKTPDIEPEPLQKGLNKPTVQEILENWRKPQVAPCRAIHLSKRTRRIMGFSSISTFLAGTLKHQATLPCGMPRCRS